MGPAWLLYARRYVSIDFIFSVYGPILWSMGEFYFMDYVFFNYLSLWGPSPPILGPVD